MHRAVMSVQDGSKASMGACKNRVLGVICGGIVGVGVVILDDLIGVDLVFYLLVGLGIMANFVLCKVLKLPLVQARVSCMTALVLGGDARIDFATLRIVAVCEISQEQESHRDSCSLNNKVTY